MPGNDRCIVVLWRGPAGGGGLSIPPRIGVEAGGELVARVADAMKPELLAEVEWLAIPNTSLRFASWPT